MEEECKYRRERNREETSAIKLSWSVTKMTLLIKLFSCCWTLASCGCDICRGRTIWLGKLAGKNWWETHSDVADKLLEVQEIYRW